MTGRQEDKTLYPAEKKCMALAMTPMSLWALFKPKAVLGQITALCEKLIPLIHFNAVVQRA